MNLNEKMIAEIAGQLGLRGNAGITAADVQRLEGKSDAELTREIMKIRKQLAANGIPYNKQLELLRNIMPMMDNKQKARLQKIIELVDK